MRGTLVLWFLIFPCLLFLIVPSFAQQAVAPPPLIQQAIDESQLTTLKGNTHPLARTRFDAGLAPPDLPMQRMLLVLKRSPEQEIALKRLLDEQHDRTSAHYHAWLTPEQFGREFGPSDQDLQVVTSWLQSHGFQIGRVTKGRTMIEFSGTADQVAQTFHTQIHRYQVRSRGYWANASDPQIPAALTTAIAGVHSLHSFRKKPQIVVSPNRISARYTPGVVPKVTFPGPNGQSFHALGPADYATIYNLNPAYNSNPAINGAGSTIAVVARSNFNTSDVFQFQIVFGLPITMVNINLDGPDPGDLGGGEEAEVVLDTTWSGAIAQGARVIPVVSASTNTTDGVDLSELYIVDNNLADVMTESFGTCEAAITNAQAQAIASLAEQAAAQGITYLVSAGDSGADGCDDPNITPAQGPLSVNALASSAFNIAVGGTMFNENGNDSTYWNTNNNPTNFGSAKSYIPENVWNESCTPAQCGLNAGLWAGGGGPSIFSLSKPSWQAGVPGIPNDGKRDVPDVSLTAAGHDPYLLCLQGSCTPDSQGFISFFAVGGTSASAPSFAGVMALVNQKMAGRQGQANYVLYRLASTENLAQCNASSTTVLPASTCVFNDVTKGNNSVPGGSPAGQYPATIGYDMASGLGSVNVANLLNNWNSVTFRATTTSLSLSPTTNVTHGSPVTVGITVAPSAGTGTPTGDVSLIAHLLPPSFTASAGKFTLNSSGAVSSTTNLLPGGNYGVSAHYAGDSTFAPSDSNSVSLTVTPEPSTTKLTIAQGFDIQGTPIPFTTGPYGSFVFLRADVAGQSGFGTPTGTVNISDTGLGNPFLPLSLNSAGNTVTPNGIAVYAPGQHSLTASYTGDSSFASSTSSPPGTFTITQASTMAGASAAGAPQGATFNAIISTSSGGNPPSGTVTFFLGGQQVGSPVQVTGVFPGTNPQTGAFQPAQASASFSDPQLANGQYTLSASYSGDTNYLASSAPPTPINIQPDFSVTPMSPVFVRLGGSGFVTLTVTALDGFKSAVNFSCAGLPSESTCTFSPASVTGSGNTTLTISTTAPHAALIRSQRPQYQILAAASGVFLAGLMLVMPTRTRRLRSVLGLMVLSLLLGGLGCGGGSSSGGGTPSNTPNPGTPVGSYNVILTATSGSISHSQSFPLIVQ